MSCSCGNNPCQCNNPTYTYNWYNTANYPCNPCSTTTICKKKVPAKCVEYRGPNLTLLSLTTNVDVELIISTMVSFLGTLQDTVANNLILQNTKNANILAALNDINTRLNVLEGGIHPPYTI